MQNLLYFSMLIISVKCINQPHIVVIIADDLGWNDVGHHGSSQISTPNIDALAYNGIALKKHYTLHICTPSRAALLTGKYPIRTGMQGYPLKLGEPRILPLDTPTLSEKFSELGYSTHLVGKWHLGFKFRNATPIGRGFKSHLGYWSGYCGYFDYESSSEPLIGFDLHRDFEPAFEYINTTFATDLFTEESIRIINNHNKNTPMYLQISHLAPHTGKNDKLEVKDENEVNKKYDYISSPGRRLFADIVNGLDTSVGRVVKALQEANMLENTIIVFMSDNGAQTYGYLENYGSNWPLRGLKFTLFDGGVRNTAIIWSKFLSNSKTVLDNVFHITDWFPTLYAAAGGSVENLGSLDGINQWPLLTKGNENNDRQFILLNIDEKDKHSAIMTGDGRYKLIQGSHKNGLYDTHSGDSGRNPLSDPKYNITEILTSDVNTAILKLNQNSPLTENEILQLRLKLEISESNQINDILTCNLNNGYCLFDLLNDPCETKDIQNEKPEIFNKLKNALLIYANDVIPQTNQPQDMDSNPKFCNGTWFTWGEIDPKLKCFSSKSNSEQIVDNISCFNLSYILIITIIIFTQIYKK